MTQNDVLDEIIQNLDPEDVPVEYIVAARITDFNGDEQVVKGIELDDILAGRRHEIADIRVVLDVKKIRKAIIMEISYVYDEVNRMFQENFRDF